MKSDFKRSSGDLNGSLYFFTENVAIKNDRYDIHNSTPENIFFDKKNCKNIIKKNVQKIKLPPRRIATVNTLPL